MIKKDLTTRKEAVVTISNGELHAVVWTDKNKRKVFYKCEPMDESELMELMGQNDEYGHMVKSNTGTDYMVYSVDKDGNHVKANYADTDARNL